MIRKSLMEVAKRTFWLVVVTILLSLPVMLLLNPTIRLSPTIESGGQFQEIMATSDGWLAMAGMIAFTLIVAGIFVFWIFPALLQLGEDISKARKDGKEEMFP